MCGIVGYVGSKRAEPVLIDSLKRLEYRGYDSAGIATLNSQKTNTTTEVRRSAGKLTNLVNLVQESPCQGQTGIGHTRWATHGKPNQINAHPHFSRQVSLVHNGIIENHLELRSKLEAKGVQLASDTDTELVAHLIAAEKNDNGLSLLEGSKRAIKKVSGAYAIAVIDESEPDTIICVKHACPLIIGLGEDENYVSSDFTAILPYTKRFIILEDGDFAKVSAKSVSVTNASNETIERPVTEINWNYSAAQKEGFKHFMLKEIHEQPVAITDTLRGRISFQHDEVQLDELNLEALRDVDRIHIVACGTSYHAGLVSKYLIEDLAKVPVDVELASEYRYREILACEKTLVIGISQSGETADTLAALKKAATKNAKLMSICNVVESSIPRLCKPSIGTLYTRAGPEVSVASTKAFITQLVSLKLFALKFAQIKDQISHNQLIDYMKDLLQLPNAVEKVLKLEPQIEKIARQFMSTADMLFLGRGVLYPIALEGALKMKELSYVHAEGYAAGEMKHGAIALIDEKMPVVVLAPQTQTYEKTVSNLEEVKSRGALIIAISEETNQALSERVSHFIGLPKVPAFISAEILTIPMQLLAYHLSNVKGLDVDQPRNLAKSVTVE